MCDKPPAPSCFDKSTLRAYAASGTCDQGTCSYAPTDSACQNGCSEGECAGDDPCNGKTCDSPPAASCLDPTTLVSYSLSGTCSGGTCSYASTTTSCPHGCSGGACVGDPCASVTCDSPPAASCVDPATLRTYASTGTCSGGSCSYAHADTSCANGCLAGACKGTTNIAPYPGVTPSRIDQGDAAGLRVARDETHVLVQRTKAPQTFAMGGLAVVTIDSSGVGSAVELTTAVEFMNGRPRADFSADSTGLFFIDTSSSPRKLVAANANGTGAHTLASGGIQGLYPAGNILVYTVDGPTSGGDREVSAVRLPDGMPVQLVAPGSVYYPHVNPNSTGSAVVVWGQSGMSYQLIQTATGASVPLGSSAQVSAFAWSPDGARLAYWNGSGALHVVLADGTGDTMVAATGAAQPRFSPDSQRLVYGVTGSTGWLATAVVHAFSGAPDVMITPSAAHPWSSELAFSPDGGILVFKSKDGTLGGAPVTGGAVVDLATSLSKAVGVPPYEFTPTHDRIAVLESPRIAAVVPLAGGPAQVLSVPVDHPPFYEGIATNPGLLVFTSPTKTQSGIFGSVVLYPTSGAGAGTVLPGKVLPAFTLSQIDHQSPFGWQGSDGGSGQIAQPFTWGWFGSEIVYEARTLTTPGIDLVAATDDLATLGVIAPSVEVWAVRDSNTPSRVFFTHVAHDGVWITPLPQTP